MNIIRLCWYLVRLALFLVRIVVFRSYQLLFFLARPGGPFMALCLVCAGLYASWHWSGPALAAFLAPLWEPVLAWSAARPAGDGLRDLVELIAPVRIELSIGTGLVLLYWPLGWLQWMLWYVLPAFPVPRRPIRPMFLWLPGKHRIEQATCRIEVPKLPLRFWDGDQGRLERYLSPQVRILLDRPLDALLPAPALPEDPVEAPQAPEPLPLAPDAQDEEGTASGPKKRPRTAKPKQAPRTQPPPAKVTRRPPPSRAEPASG